MRALCLTARGLTCARDQCGAGVAARVGVFFQDNLGVGSLSVSNLGVRKLDVSKKCRKSDKLIDAERLSTGMRVDVYRPKLDVIKDAFKVVAQGFSTLRKGELDDLTELGLVTAGVKRRLAGH